MKRKSGMILLFFGLALLIGDVLLGRVYPDFFDIGLIVFAIGFLMTFFGATFLVCPKKTLPKQGSDLPKQLSDDEIENLSLEQLSGITYDADTDTGLFFLTGLIVISVSILCLGIFLVDVVKFKDGGLLSVGVLLILIFPFLGYWMKLRQRQEPALTRYEQIKTYEQRTGHKVLHEDLNQQKGIGASLLHFGRGRAILRLTDGVVLVCGAILLYSFYDVNQVYNPEDFLFFLFTEITALVIGIFLIWAGGYELRQFYVRFGKKGG